MVGDEQERLLANDELAEDSEPSVVTPIIPTSVRPTLEDDILPNIYGMKLFINAKFWLICIMMLILSGTGIMYINNIGSISQVLYFAMQRKNGGVYIPAEAARWQAYQVSILSLTNFSSRIIIGLVSDVCKHRFSLPRSSCLIIVSLVCFLSQVVAANVDDIKHLYFASALLGFGYGCIYSLFPMVCIEWFGILHFSANYGYMHILPVAGVLFSVEFGRNLDAHGEASNVSSRAISSLASEAAPRCHSGRLCYVDTLYLTMASCFLSMVISAWVGWRDWRKSRMVDVAMQRGVEWDAETG